MTKPVAVSENDSVMTKPEPGLRRQVMATNDSMMVVRHRMDAGWQGARHAHPHEQVVHVLSGAIRLVIDQEVYELRAGDNVIVPGGVEHEASASEVSEVLDVFTPAREDYR